MYRFKALTIISAVLALIVSPRDGWSQEITVTLLGTGNSPSTPDRFAMSTLVQAGDQVLVFDAGRGVLQRLVQAGLTAAQVDAIFLTHLHSDHIVGLPELWLSGWFMSGRARPWKLLGPTGTASMAGHLKQAFTIDIQARVEENAPFLPAIGADIDAGDIRPGVIFDANGVRVTAIEVDHRAISPAYGYRVDYAGRSVVLSGDTQPSENLVKAAEGADLLVHEVSETTDELVKANPRLARSLTFHTRAADAGTVFTRVHPKLAVYSHLNTRGMSRDDLVKRTRATYTGPLMVGEDLMKFVVGESIAILQP